LIAQKGEDMKKLVSFLFFLFLSTQALAETFIITTGSDDKTAISGFDTVAFFTENRAVPGKPEFEFGYLGAKWIFSSQENLSLFQKNPEKYVPQGGGQCAWGVSENLISKKKFYGSFSFIDGKLYLFTGRHATDSGAKNDFINGRWPADRRIIDGDKNWPDLKKKLEEGKLVQGNSSYFR
jgi:YHS domain-containing protein